MTLNETTIRTAVDLIRQATHIVALTGAGISTPSGIPDFRSADSGLWDRADPMVVASLQMFLRDPRPFYKWFHPLLATVMQAQPNPAHRALATLESAGKLAAVVTQNIDNLHSQAGSRAVYELHGHLRQMTCMQCHQVDLAAPVLSAFMVNGHVPYHHCGGVLKPNVVFFGELLPHQPYAASVATLQKADLVIVVGSSMEVAPASELPLIARQRGAKLMIVNYDATPWDDKANVVIRADAAKVLPQIVALALADAGDFQ
jgi:NAD-dependent deacetylase